MNVLASDIPFESKYLKVMGSKIHYFDEKGSNNSDITFVCLHGNPTSNYLWRNVIPILTSIGRVIAPDLVGFGKSDKPDIDYKVVTHSKYLNEFINILNLKNIVFVLHDWGTALGINYACLHEDKVKGIAFMEGIVKPLKWDFGNPLIRTMFGLLRTQRFGKWLIINQNFFVNRVLLSLGTKRKLTAIEKSCYKAPFLDKQSRVPIYVFPNELPINGKPKETNNIVAANHEWMQKTKIPKLLLWIKPGVLITKQMVNDISNRYPNLSTTCLGSGAHYVPEDFPIEIGNAIIEWVKKN